MTSVQVKRASTADATRISEFLSQFADQIRATPEADISDFLQSIEPAVLAREMEQEILVYWLLTADLHIGALLGLRHGEHLYHLFVRSDLQRLGYGKRLCEDAMGYLRAAGVQSMTVSSSVHAVGFYQAMGFLPTGPQQTKNGISFVPMEAKLVRRSQ